MAHPEGEQIFRAYDIRGIYGETLTEELMEKLGRALSTVAEGRKVVVARDGRTSGESLSRAFIKGILSTGKDVVYLGILPLGAGMFHAWKNRMTFAYVTASHLGRGWNGLKFFWSNGLGFMDEDLRRVREAFQKRGLPQSSTRGTLQEPDNREVIQAYIRHLHSKIKPERPIKLTLDTGNGAAGVLARELFSSAGFDVKAISEQVDGTFPSRSPDPTTDNLDGLKKALRDRDLGFAYDGDGDRVVFLDEKGEKVTPEQVSYIMLSELLKDEQGPVIANIETTRTIDSVAKRFGREVHRVRVGHNHLMKGASERGACFGMEPSGHYTVPSIFPFDDSLAISYYFACILSRKQEPLSGLVKDIPVLPFRRSNFDVPDMEKFGVVESIAKVLRKSHERVNTLDGVRVELDGGWVLIRPSNTQPVIRLTVEARTKEELESIMEEFTTLLRKYIKT